MNKFQKAGLTVVAISGVAFAGGKLWGPNTQDFPSLQVQVPDAVECWLADPDPGTSACYESTAGWWFGYKYAGGYAEVKKEGQFVEFGEGVGISNEADGSSLIDADGLTVKLTAQSEDGTKYGGAGIGFNYGKPESRTQNINSKGGYCLTYTSDGPLLFKLGHDESTYTDECTIEVALAASSSPKKVDLSFSDNTFDLPGWCKTSPPAGKTVIDKATALSNAVGVKIATNATNSSTAEVIVLTVHQLGWQGECDTNTPILKSASIAGLKMVQNGRMFSLSMERAASVQVINLQGAVVHTQSVAPANHTMNLSHLPTGVYMVRIPSLGYTNKVILK